MKYSELVDFIHSKIAVSLSRKTTGSICSLLLPHVFFQPSKRKVAA